MKADFVFKSQRIYSTFKKDLKPKIFNDSELSMTHEFGCEFSKKSLLGTLSQHLKTCKIYE